MDTNTRRMEKMAQDIHSIKDSMKRIANSIEDIRDVLLAIAPKEKVDNEETEK